MRRPHAAFWDPHESVAARPPFHDVGGQRSLAGEVSPGWRAGVRLEAISPPFCKDARAFGFAGRRHAGALGTKPIDIRNMIARIEEPVSAKVLGEAKIRLLLPATADRTTRPWRVTMTMLVFASIFDRTAGAFLDVDLPSVVLSPAGPRS